jgi:hypothetical protein
MRARAVLAALLLGACTTADPRLPPFAARPYQPLHRAAVVAIAEREWRAFGSPVDDGTAPATADKPERDDGMWQRVGEYWFTGMPPNAPELAWTGKHDAQGRVFPRDDDGEYAWSAAFVSYVMRIAGATDGFPYAAAHADYIAAAVAGRARLLAAHAPADYAPLPGDLICMGRGWAASVSLDHLPATRYPAHCDIVVARAPDMLGVVGGNVDDAVTMKHVPLAANGRLADSDGVLADRRWPWFVVLELLAPP